MNVVSSVFRGLEISNIWFGPWIKNSSPGDINHHAKRIKLKKINQIHSF